jgi:hypothetical protein
VAVIVAAPKPVAVSVGAAAGAVAPAAMVTVAGDTDTFDGSLLFNTRVTADGAGDDRLIVNGAFDWPKVSDGAVRLIAMFSTVIVAVASGMFAVVAVMVALPAPTPVTGTVALVTPVAKLTVAGTVATAELLEVRVATSPPGGGTWERLSVRFCVPVPLMVAVAGEKVMNRLVTNTDDVADGNPNEVTVIVSVAPSTIPLSVGC